MFQQLQETQMKQLTQKNALNLIELFYSTFMVDIRGGIREYLHSGGFLKTYLVFF